MGDAAHPRRVEIRAVAKARGVPMRAEVDAIITAGLDAVGAP